MSAKFFKSSPLLSCVFIWVFLVSDCLYSFPLDDQTAGTLALNYKKRSKFWAAFHLLGVDATIKTSPPDTKKIDRSIQSLAIIGGDFVFANQMGLRINLKAENIVHKQEEEVEPKSPISEEYTIAKPSIDYTYVNPKGLELFAGIRYIVFSAYDEEQDSDDIELKTSYDQAALPVFHGGIVKRQATWSGGFYYVQGKETTRSFSKTTDGEDAIEGNSKVHIPTEYGIVAEVILNPLIFDLDLAMVQAGEGGEKSEDGITVRDDYLRAHSNVLYQMTGWGLKLSLGYQTLSYSNNAFINLDTIPFTRAKLQTLFGSVENHAFIGMIYGYGEDGQSITEFNAKYELQAFGLSLGLNYAI